MKTILFCTCLLVSTSVSAATVRVEKLDGAWTLFVDDKPYYVKGIGCNDAKGKDGVDYLKMAKETGANTVRTWGITPREYFDKAKSYGLMVNAGVWFNPIRGDTSESYKDKEHTKKLKEDTLAHVRALKDHPALLTWNLGNEVFAFTEDETEKQAFGEFLEDLYQAVKKEDPDHPITFAAANTQDFPYLKDMVPSLDIVGTNIYGGMGGVVGWMKANNYDKPLLMTEYGPFGAWDRATDANGLAYDPLDQNKASNYANHWRSMVNAKEQIIGGFAFVLGDQRNQGSLTWWNINYGRLKRQAFWTLYTLYTGKQPENLPPKIKLMQVDRVSNLEAGDTVNVKLTVEDPEDDKLKVDYFITDLANDPVLVEPFKMFRTSVKKIGIDEANVQVPVEPGLYRLYAAVEDRKGNIAIANRSIQVGAAHTRGTP